MLRHVQKNLRNLNKKVQCLYVPEGISDMEMKWFQADGMFRPDWDVG